MSWDMQDLSSSNGKLLLEYARQAIANHLEGQRAPVVPSALKEILLCRGCFVTLKKQNRLRGCIGTFDDKQPLIDNVRQMAVAAATEDFRFPPVLYSEIAQIKIEISILGELRKMNSIQELKIGKHGIIVSKGGYSGTYLPQVATEQGWTAEKFVQHCACQKAGIPLAEVSEAEVFLYEIQKFSD
ncbi:MAG: AmmeMemoRadiSam system protein A [Candidatus Omnitrophica bacterium]|nr:AmmeMemoRadiSam system protein A [Candidatus Omnitrophota bacterium]MDD5672311.1 AmmeMemoRadiSam system protein A [Candidatus Omnitrophota bacterium]